MATDVGTLDPTRDLIFKPEHLAVDREVRKILKRVIKLERDSLEFVGEVFTGFVRFEIPKGDCFQPADVLTVCIEMAKSGIGGRAEVETWLVVIRDPHTIDICPAEFTLQEEDLEEPPSVSRRAFIDMVRPSNGWLVLIVPSMLLWLCR